MSRGRIFIVPRWGGTPTVEWYQWLKPQLEALDYSVHVMDMPDPSLPRLDTWPPALAAAIGSPDEKTHFIGHSVGCQTIMRYLASLPPGSRVGKVLCVAGWWTIDASVVWESIVPWIETPIDLEAIRSAAPEIHVLISDNDEFTSDHEANTRAWQSKVNARVVVVPNEMHFRGERIDAIRDLALRIFG